MEDILTYNFHELIETLLRMVHTADEVRIYAEKRETFPNQNHDEKDKEELRKQILERLLEIPPLSLEEETDPRTALAHLLAAEKEGLIYSPIQERIYVSNPEQTDRVRFWHNILPNYIIQKRYSLTPYGEEYLRNRM